VLEQESRRAGHVFLFSIVSLFDLELLISHHDSQDRASVIELMVIHLLHNAKILDDTQYAKNLKFVC